MNSQACEAHRKELLRFLLCKTAPVRGGVKPGELLRVRHCYRSCSPEGNHLCLYRGRIFALLKLDYLELRRERDSSLVLFYHKEALCTVLAHPENQAVLGPHGYPFCGPIELFLDVLKQRFRSEHIPHEVGAFLGYPAKDVLGFIGKLPKTPVSGGNWQVFGDAGESVARMQLYRRVERMARNLLDRSDNLEIFFNHLTKFYRKDRRLANG